MDKKYIIIAAALLLGILSFIIYPSPDSTKGLDRGTGDRIEEEIKIEHVIITTEDLELTAAMRSEAAEDVDIPVEDVDIPEETEQAASYQHDELFEMQRIIYLENGITWPECSYETVYLTACVILNRMYDWEECHTITDVIYEPGQYSTAYRYEDYDGSALGTSNPEGWEISYAAMQDALAGCDRNPHFQSRSQQGDIYYIDPYTGEVFCY